MGKFTAIQTYSRFQSLWNENKINRNSLTFILDTGQLYTHGIFLNSVAYGTEANGAIDITIAGTSKSLSLSSHTHSNYLEKNKNIDIGAYKIVSGDKDLLYYNANNTYLGNSSSPVYLVGTEGKIVKGSTTYTLLDTENFSIVGRTSSGIILSNTALFTYGDNTFSIDYVKRYNSSVNFDTLNSVTSAGTTTVNGQKYGFMTFCEDGTINPSWSQIRIDVAAGKLEFRTSSKNTWVSPITSIPTNTATVAGIVSAPGANNSGKIWKTDANGTPAWRDEVPNITTTAVISNSSTGKTNITTDQNDPYYNLIEGSNITRSIQFKGGLGISINSNNGVIRFDSADNTISSTLSNIDLISQWSNVEDLTTKLGNDDGSYIIQITYGSRIYTGYFSYVSDSSGVEEEILLHCSGKVESSPLERGRLYAKIGLNGSKVYLQLATTQNENNATVTIKYKKVL